ncbi:MAG: glycosyltransferase [Acidiferrobacterales bacterium]
MPVGKIDRYLELSLDSINAQTFRDFELVIVCDACIYESLCHIINQSRFEFRKRVIRTALAGFSFSLNLGLASSASEFIARWDADDLCDPNRFERQLEEFANHPDLAVVGTRGVLIDERGERISHHNFKFFECDAQIRRALKYRQPLLHTSLMFRAKILYDNKGYQYGHSSEDHELFIRIARDKSLTFRNLPDVFSYYRRHNGQLTSNARQYEQFCDISGFMITEFLRTGNVLYVVGSLANLPAARRVRQFWREILRAVGR